MPTTVARWWSCSAAVTISAAEAVLPSTSTTSGIVGAIASPVAHQRLRRLLAPARGHDHALGDEHARDQLRLLDEAAAVVAQVEHDPAGALVQRLFDGLRALRRGRPALKVASATTPELHAVDGVGAPRPRPALRSIARVIVTVRSGACWRGRRGASISSVTSVPGAPLISADRLVAREPCERAPVDGDDQVARSAARRAPRARRRTRARSAGRACIGADGDADARRSAAAVLNSRSSLGVR